MNGELYFESCGDVSLSSPRRGTFSRRVENGYDALDGIAADGTEYVTLTGYDAGDADALARAAERELASFLQRFGAGSAHTVLVAGIGNVRIEADSLGPLVSERIAVGATGSGKRVLSFAAGVPESTGIGTEATVSAVARLVGAELLIAVDSLAALSPGRLCRAVQISGGARPGSGASENAEKIGRGSAGCPVVTVGVPTAVMGRLSRGEEETEGLFTVCGIGASVVSHAQALSAAINSYLGS